MAMSRRALGVLVHLSIGAAALAFGGCQGCLNLDEYTMVPTGGAAGAGGTGAGGAPGCSVPGALYVTSVQPAGKPSGDTSDPCAVAEVLPAGVEVRAFDPDAHECVARARVLAADGVTLDGTPRLRFEQGPYADVAVGYRGGALTLPASCSGGEAVVVDEEPGAAQSLLVARLQRTDATFCTQWARRAFTTDPGAVKTTRIHSVRSNDVGEVVVVGSLGGATRFEDVSGAQDVAAGAFFARWVEGGSLAEVVTLPGQGPSDAVTDVVPSGADWLLTGTVQREQPACQGCSGVSAVADPAAFQCAGGGAGGASPGTGGTGGVAGTGGMTGSAGMAGSGGTGTGGMAGSGGAGTGGMAGSGGMGTGGVAGSGGAGGGGGALPDAQNAFLWPLVEKSGCTQFETFGSDRLGEGDAQVGLGLSVVPASAGCARVWSGLAGRDAWPMQAGAAPALFDAGGASMDGFVSRSEGTGALCDGGQSASWSVRVTPLAMGASAVVERGVAARCPSVFGDVSASALVRSPGGGNVALYRCTSGDGCDMNASLVPLSPSSDDQLVILALRYDGRTRWSGAFGPVLADADAGAGTFTGRSHHDLVLDSQDRLYAVFTTSGPLTLQNVNPFFDCEGLVENLAEGTYLVSLRQYSGEEAMCDWFYRIGP